MQRFTFERFTTFLSDHKRVWVAIATLPVLASMTLKAAADRGNFRIYNESKAPIVGLYISSSYQDSWEENLLATTSLPPAHHIQVAFGEPSLERSAVEDCQYDIRAEFADGEILENFKVNICEAPAYTFSEIVP